MTNTELETFRRRLLVRHNRTIDQAHLPIHISDIVTNTFEQQFKEEVAAALERIDQGTFGCCEECGKTIPVGRLEVLPYTRSCVECARKPQRGATERR